MSRVALIFQRFDHAGPLLGVLTARVEKLGIETLGAVLARASHDVSVIDNELEQTPSRELAARLNDESFDIIGFSFNSGNFESTLELAGMIASGPLVVLGGVAASLHPLETLEQCGRADMVVMGEGETPLAQLAAGRRDVPGTVTRQGPNPAPVPAVDLDGLPPLEHRLLRRYDQPTINTSRGCRFACEYCAESRFLREARLRWHARSAELVLDELRGLVARGANHVWIVDGDFFGPKPARAVAIAEGILQEKLPVQFEIDARATDVEEPLFRLLRDAGLRRVFIGVESLSPSFLRRMKKGVQPAQVHQALETLKQLGVGYTLGMIPFTEEATLEELAEDVRFMEDQGFENIGSDLFQGLKNYSALRPAIPAHFQDERVGRVFAEFRSFGQRLGWCFGARVRSCTGIAERQQIVREINTAVGEELMRLVSAAME